MEKMRWSYKMRASLRYTVIILLLFIVSLHGQLVAQPRIKIYTIHDGKMQIELSKHLSESSLDSFINQFNLSELALKQFIRSNFQDSIRKAGWMINENTNDLIIISKKLFGFEDFDNPGDKILFMGKQPSLASRFPIVSQGVVFGYNVFRNKKPFFQTDSTITFFLKGHRDAKRVILSGSFVDWSPEKLSMIKTDSGWIADVKLRPGKYWYKFIVDGNWKVDEDNLIRENDGLGNMNSVLYKTNYLFRFDPPGDPKNVLLAGSFNDWNQHGLEMKKVNKNWEFAIYLAEGTHTYRFVADGEWYTDPSNPDQLPNEFNDFNSVIRIGNPFVFKLDGHIDAREVILSGNFNGWRKDELSMKKTASGWELAYTLGPGNYYYMYIVDGLEIPTAKGPLIIEPNYTFRLKGHARAKEVFLAGDFNNWDPSTLSMKKEGDDWVFTVHLSPGKHLYKFIVNGNWIRDPDNKLWEENRFGTGDSVIWFEK